MCMCHCRLGYTLGKRGLWGHLGFDSWKLPHTSAVAVDKQLQILLDTAVRRMPWFFRALQAFRGELGRSDKSGLWQLLPLGKPPVGRWTSSLPWAPMKQAMAGPARHAPNARHSLDEDGLFVHGSHIANALVAAALVFVPLAGAGHRASLVFFIRQSVSGGGLHGGLS